MICRIMIGLTPPKGMDLVVDAVRTPLAGLLLERLLIRMISNWARANNRIATRCWTLLV